MEGVGGIIRLEENPKPREILHVVDRALTTALAERIVADLASHRPAFAQHAIRWSIESSEARPTAREMARALGLSPGSLRRKLGATGLPPPRVLLLWGRLIQATHLLEQDRDTVENVAFRLGYSTVGALRKAIKSHLGCAPTVLLEKGGLAWTLGAFQREVLGT
jgi:AraC-like DNA-binding protein